MMQGQLAGMKQQIQGPLTAALAGTYATVATPELQQYLDYLRSPAGSKVSALTLAALGAVQHRVAHFLCFQRVAERRPGGFAGGESFQKIGHLVHEAMFVADLQAGNPPLRHVGMVAVGDVQRAPAAFPAVVAVIEILEPVKIVQIPGNRGVFAVDLKCVKRLVSARITGRLEVCQRAIGKAGKSIPRTQRLLQHLQPIRSHG